MRGRREKKGKNSRETFIPLIGPFVAIVNACHYTRVGRKEGQGDGWVVGDGEWRLWIKTVLVMGCRDSLEEYKMRRKDVLVVDGEGAAEDERTALIK